MLPTRHMSTETRHGLIQTYVCSALRNRNKTLPFDDRRTIDSRGTRSRCDTATMVANRVSHPFNWRLGPHWKMPSVQAWDSVWPRQNQTCFVESVHRDNSGMLQHELSAALSRHLHFRICCWWLVMQVFALLGQLEQSLLGVSPYTFRSVPRFQA